MRAYTVLAVLLLSVGAMASPALAKPHASPSPAPAATPTPPPEIPRVRKAAIAQMVSWQAGILDRARYSADFNTQITDDHVGVVSRELGQLGPFVDAKFLGLKVLPTAPQGVITYLYQMECSRRPVYELLSIDPAGKIAGIVFMDSLEPLNPATPSPSPSP